MYKYHPINPGPLHNSKTDLHPLCSFNNNQQIEDSSPYPIFNKIDQKKIIKLEDNKYSTLPTNHPTAEQCKEISDIIFNVIK